MKHVAKKQCPDCLWNFIKGQLSIEPEPVNVTYRCFPDKPTLLHLLTEEQFGLCGYTGAPVDEERISDLQNSTDSEASFESHIEHLKCQDACKHEIRSSGRAYGSALGDDLNYYNMIAALKVEGSEEECFGAVIKKNYFLPVLPTHRDCQDHFRYREDGGVDGRSAVGTETIDILKLDHKTLFDWRSSAIDAWLNDEIIRSKDDVLEIISAVQEVVDGRLVEYAFVIEAIASRYL